MSISTKRGRRGQKRDCTAAIGCNLDGVIVIGQSAAVLTHGFIRLSPHHLHHQHAGN